MGLTPDWPTRDLLSHRVATTPEATALVDATDGTAWTYADLDAVVNDLVPTLRSAHGSPVTGGEARPRVGIGATTTPAFVAALHATWRFGATAIPLSVSQPAETLRTRLDRLDVGLYLDTADEDQLSAVDWHGRKATVDSALDGDPDHEHERSGHARADATWGPDETALILFTSGTTGRAKGVGLTPGNLVASAAASAFRLGVSQADRWYGCLPTNHMGGLAPIVRSTLYGTGVVLESGFDANRTPALMAEHDATGISLVPTMLRRLLDRDWQPHEALRFVLLGGAPASPELLETCQTVGVPVYPTYGTTETASQIATATPDEAFANPETVGSPLVTASVTIVDAATGEPVEAGTVGELVVDGPIVTPGYLDETATEVAMGPHGLHTGDLAKRNTAGKLQILGRLDDAIQTGGETVHPTQVIEALRELPDVADAAVVGVSDPEWGERVAALVVPTEESAPDTDALRASLRERLAPHAVPKVLGTADQLPRTASGTVDRDAVRERLRE